MMEGELHFTNMVEYATKQIALATSAFGLKANIDAAIAGATIARDARLALEKITGVGIITSKNFLRNLPFENNKKIKK